MVSEEAFCALREITGRRAVTTALLSCLDTSDVKAAVLSRVVEFLEQQRGSMLYTIEYIAQLDGFGRTITTMEKQVSKIDALLASLG